MLITRKHIPNLITASRILGMLLLFLFMPFKTNVAQCIIVGLFVLICLTDALDGWVARRFNSVSELGQFLDPLADKIVILVLLPLIQMGVISALPGVIILMREFAVMGIRIVVVTSGKGVVPASRMAKLKTIGTLVLCTVLLARVPVVQRDGFALIDSVALFCDWAKAVPEFVIQISIWAIVGITVVSFIDYMRQYVVNNR